MAKSKRRKATAAAPRPTPAQKLRSAYDQIYQLNRELESKTLEIEHIADLATSSLRIAAEICTAHDHPDMSSMFMRNVHAIATRRLPDAVDGVAIPY